jgi:anti-sigma regulatory factor (Ser/Thr protein kinase)
VIVIVAMRGVSSCAPRTDRRPGPERVVASIGAVGTPTFGPVSVTVPAAPHAIDVLRSVAGVVAGRTPMGFDRVDDLRLAVSEAAGRLIQAAGGTGTVREEIAVDDHSVRIDLTMLAADIGRWPIGPNIDAFSWVVIDTLADTATESMTDDGPGIGLRFGFVTP